MQGVGTAVARRAGARHDRDARARLHHAADGFEAAHMHTLADALSQSAGDVFQKGLDGAVGMDADKLIGIHQVHEMRGTLRGQRVAQRCHHGELIPEQGRDVQPFDVDIAGHEPEIPGARADRDDDVARDLLFELHVHVGVFR
ncbi:hypothetical protein D3C87_1447450 [compost metagenome]